MKAADIQQKSDKELQAFLIDSRNQLAQLRIDMRTKQMPNVKQVIKLKKTIARTLTITNQRKEESHG